MQHWNLIDKSFLLKNCKIFADLDLDLILAIADKTTVAQVEKNRKVFDLGEEAHRMFLIVEGAVAIKEGNQTLATLLPGEFFGDESLFNERPRAYCACTLEETTLLALSHTHLMAILSECPTVAYGLLSVYASCFGFRPR